MTSINYGSEAVHTKATLVGFEEIKAAMEAMPKWCMRATNSAMSTIGYKLKGEAKTAVARNSFGWPKISKLTQTTRMYPATRNRELQRKAIIMDAPATNKFWGVLANLLVYSPPAKEQNGILKFGFMAGTFGMKIQRSGGETTKVANVIRKPVVELAKMLTEGFERVVTVKQQRYFWALGFYFQVGRVLKIPARPLIGPVFVMCKPIIPEWFRTKFWERLQLYNEKAGAGAVAA